MRKLVTKGRCYPVFSVCVEKRCKKWKVLKTRESKSERKVGENRRSAATRVIRLSLVIPACLSCFVTVMKGRWFAVFFNPLFLSISVRVSVWCWVAQESRFAFLSTKHGMSENHVIQLIVIVPTFLFRDIKNKLLLLIWMGRSESCSFYSGLPGGIMQTLAKAQTHGCMSTLI